MKKYPGREMLSSIALMLARKPAARTAAAALAISVALAAGPVLAEDGIFDLGLLNGESESYPYGISADGSVVVGEAIDGDAGNASRAFRWTEATGMQSLGVLNGGSQSFATGVSGDGSVVVGTAADGDAGNAWRAFRWTEATGIMQSLGVLNGGSTSTAAGISGDGSVVVGAATDGDAGNDWRAFRWTEATGSMQSLGVLNGGSWSHGYGVSGDGSVVVGVASDGDADNEWRAFRWTEATGIMQSLGVLNGGNWSYAYGVSADGSVVVGEAADGSASNSYRAFRWTEATGMQSLGVLNEGSWSYANGVSGDGSVVVGAAADGDAGDADRGFRWSEATGMQSVEDWLRDSGVTVPGGLATSYANATNYDGSVVVGTLDNNRGFIARAASGLITLEDVSDSLNAAALGRGMLLSSTGMAINGAHSRPLSRRVGQGKKAFWLAGDWGREDHGSRDGSLGLAEVGGGYNFGPMQLNLSIGYTGSRQDMDLGGRVKADGAYLMVEAIAPVMAAGDGGLWLTAGAYGYRGDAEIRRGYLNAGTPDVSTGKPDTETWGVRVRLDWENAAMLGSAGLSPYADLSYIRTELDAYTEAGGGFPASFDAKSDKATEARIGVNAGLPITTDFSFIGMLEAAHRFEKTGARTSGEVTGLFGFDLDGQRLDRDWVRLGAGMEGRVGPGVASLMLNITTKGEVPSAWLAAGYQVEF